MPLRRHFLLFLGPLHLVLVGLAWQLHASSPVFFIVAEVLLLISVVLSLRLYRAVARPLHLLAAGTAALQTQDFSLKFVPVGQPEMDRLIGVFNGMIDALRHERVRQQERSIFLERLLHASPAGILILDFDGRIASANPAAGRFLGVAVAALPGQWPAELPGAWGQLLADLPPDGSARSLRLSGLQRYRAQASQFRDRGFVRRFVVLEELTQELMAQEKDAYSALIRMMAHEVNNSIGAINSILGSFGHYTAQLAPADQPDFAEALAVSMARNTRLANFIGGFAGLVRLPPPTRQPTDVHALLRGIGRLLQPQSAQRGIVWHWHLAAAPLVVSLDAQQLEQALLNVAKNALEAIGQGGNVWVSTTASPAGLVIENDGPPLAPAVQRQLFTPFFSTKRDGQGIGLTLVRDVLLAHGFGFSLGPGAAGRTAFALAFGAAGAAGAAGLTDPNPPLAD